MRSEARFSASDVVEELSSAAGRYSNEVAELRGPLELEVSDAVSVCWVKEKGRTVQARGKFGLRTKTVLVHEAIFLEEAERKVLSGSLSQWQRKAEGDVAAAALDVGVAEARMLHASSSILEESERDPSTLLTLLDTALSSIAGTGAPALLSSPSTFSALRNLSFLVASRYQSSVGGLPDFHLLSILLKYVGRLDWAASIFQPSLPQIPQLLPLLLPSSSSNVPNSAAGGSLDIKAQHRLLLQFPWEKADLLRSEQISSAVIPPLVGMVGRLGQHPASDDTSDTDSAGLATLIVEVLETLAVSLADASTMAYSAVLLSTLCLSSGGSAAEVSGTLGLSAQDQYNIRKADILKIAQLVWSSSAGQPKAAIAAQVLLHVNWEEVVPQLPKDLQLRLLLTLLLVFKGVGSAQPSTGGATYFAWVWHLLEGPLGATLTQLSLGHGAPSDSQAAYEDSIVNEAHMLCMTEAPAAREDVTALWAWLRAHLALGLLERWAAVPDSQATGHADALLEGMQLFSLPASLVNIGKPQAAIGILLRFFDTATFMGQPFFRSQLQRMASVLVEAVQNSDKNVLGPIRSALDAAVRRGVAAAEGAHPQQASPAASPAGQREHAQPKRGSTVSPGAEALSCAAHWLAVLTCAAAQGPLPAPALALMSDLVQLLYYYSPPASSAGASDVRGRAGSPVIQECVDAIRGAVGVDGMRGLWVPLLKQHSADPVGLQWLPLLACWLSTAVGPQPVQQEAESDQARMPASAGEQQRRSLSPKKPPRSPTHGRPEEGQQTASTSADRSQHERDAADRGAILDRDAEEALQLQEAAVRVGYGPAALPMWEEFLSRYFCFQEQLEAITPCTDISAHLAELSHLYEASCPVLSNIYMLLAPLSPESLPGGTPDFVAGNTEALCALMQLHPLKLGVPPKAQPPGPPPQPVDRAPLSSQRKEPVPPAAYEEILKHQEEIASQITSSAGLLRSWSHRREKRQAATTPPRPSVAQLASAQDDSDSDSDSRQPGRPDDLEELPTLKSPRMSQGSFDGDVPEVISQAQARLWDGLSGMGEHLESLNAVVRELVVRRYRPIDVKRVEAGEYGDMEEIPADEDPDFQVQYQKNRESALAAVMDFVTGEGVAAAARLLYQVEVLLLGPPTEVTPAPSKGGKGAVVDPAEVEQWVSCRAQLLAVIGEVILDESMPAAAVPFLMALFEQSAQQLLPSKASLKVELAARLMAAFASRGQSATREAEAVSLLSASLGSEQLLAEGALAEYYGCLRCVLDCCPKLPPSAVARLLACFDLGGFSAALLHRGSPPLSDQEQIQLGGVAVGSAAAAQKPSPAAARILGLAVDALAAASGEGAGVELLAGLLAAGGHAAYFAACLAAVLSARSTAAAREAGLNLLTRQPFETFPLDVVVEAIVLVTDSLNQAESARYEVPYALLQKLIQAPCALSALRQVVATGNGRTPDGNKNGQGVAAWTASISEGGGSRAAGSGTASSSSSSSNSSATAQKDSSAHVMLLAVQEGRDAVAHIELLIGACLQSIVRRFGSGLDGVTMTEELTQLLALLMEPVGANAWMVDWLWSLYKEALQPFLVLAGPASDGAAIHRFRECWACLPWHRATFHCNSPHGLAELGAYLLAPDHGALDLLHALAWEPILQRLVPAAEQPGAPDGLASSGAQPPPPPLDADGRQWATQLALLALQSLVLLPSERLPGWLLGLTSPLPATGSRGSDGALSGLRLPHVIAAANAQALQDVLCNCIEGLPFLLQPLMDAPALIQGDPGPRLLHVAGLLTSAATLSSSPAVGAMAAAVVQSLMFTSVCRGFISGQGHSADASPREGSGTTEVIECWHLTAEEHSVLVTDCLLPLCRLHSVAAMHAASILQRPDDQPAAAAVSGGSDAAGPAQGAAAGWRAPQLSQLVDRLGSHAAATPSQAALPKVPPVHGVRRGSRLAVLAPVELGGPGTLQSAAGHQRTATGSERYIAAAVPAHVLLTSLLASPRTVLTNDPLPFANAETPLREPPPDLGHRDGGSSSSAGGEGPDMDAASNASSDSKSDFLDRALSMAQRLKIQRRGKRGPTRQRLLRAEAADLCTIQSHIAALIEDSCQRRADELPLSVVRVAFTCAPLRRLPMGSALLEDLVQFLLLSSGDQAPPAAVSLGRPASGGSGGTSRQRSYTEQALTAAADSSAPSAADLGAVQAEAAAALLRTLEGLDDVAVMQVCTDAADARTPLVQALASEKARCLVALDERASWRHNVSEVLKAAAAAEARPGAPGHIAAVWLAALLWLEDPRWRKLRTGGAPTEALEGLLDALSRRVLLLNLPPPAKESAPATPSGTGSDAFDFQPHPAASAQAVDGGKALTRLTQNFKRMLPGAKGGRGTASGAGDEDTAAHDSTAAATPQSSKGLGRLKTRFLRKEQQAATVDIPPSTFDYESRMGFPEGPRFGRLEPIPSGDSEAGSSRPQTPSRNSDYSSPPGSPEEPQQKKGFTSLFVRTSSSGLPAEEQRQGEGPARPRPARLYAARLAGDVKKALSGGSKKAEAAAAEAAAKEAEAEAAAAAATDAVVRLGLAAFAVSAYIKTVLCPSLSSYTPRMSSASLAADLAASGGSAFAAAVLGAQLQRQSASLGSLASATPGGTPRIAHSHTSSPSASLDKLQREDLLMHELDQVLETRAELDSLEEIAQCPLVAARADHFRGFLAAAPQLLQPAASVAHFQRELVHLLFPDVPFLAVWACLPPACHA